MEVGRMMAGEYERLREFAEATHKMPRAVGPAVRQAGIDITALLRERDRLRGVIEGIFRLARDEVAATGAPSAELEEESMTDSGRSA